MLAPRLIASLLDLSQLRGKANASRLGLNALAIEVRLAFGELADRPGQSNVVSLLLVPQGGGVGVGELGREGRFALDPPGNIGSGRLILAPRFGERSTGVGNLFFERSARGAFLSDLLLQLRLEFGRSLREHVEMCGLRLEFTPGCAQDCLQFAGLDNCGRGCRRMALLRGGARVKRRSEIFFSNSHCRATSSARDRRSSAARASPA